MGSCCLMRQPHSPWTHQVTMTTDSAAVCPATNISNFSIKAWDSGLAHHPHSQSCTGSVQKVLHIKARLISCPAKALGPCYKAPVCAIVLGNTHLLLPLPLIAPPPPSSLLVYTQSPQLPGATDQLQPLPKHIGPHPALPSPNSSPLLFSCQHCC